MRGFISDTIGFLKDGVKSRLACSAKAFSSAVLKAEHCIDSVERKWKQDLDWKQLAGDSPQAAAVPCRPADAQRTKGSPQSTRPPATATPPRRTASKSTTQTAIVREAQRRYSTLRARARTSRDMVSPLRRKVVMFTEKSNSCGSCTARSRTFAPRRSLEMYSAALASLSIIGT